MSTDLALGQDLRDKLGTACPYCGTAMSSAHHTRMPTRDHLLPRCRGGTLDEGNKVICCRWCNQGKGDRTIHEWLAHLIRTRDWRAQIVADFIELLKPKEPFA